MYLSFQFFGQGQAGGPLAAEDAEQLAVALEGVITTRTGWIAGGLDQRPDSGKGFKDVGRCDWPGVEVIVGLEKVVGFFVAAGYGRVQRLTDFSSADEAVPFPR